MIIVPQLIVHTICKNSSKVLVWPRVQPLGTSVSGSDTVVAEEVSMAACSIPKSSMPLSLRPCGRSLCWWRPRKADTGRSSTNPKGGASYCCFTMGTNSKTKNA